MAATWRSFEEYERSHLDPEAKLQTRILELENKLEARDLIIVETEK